MVGRQQGRALAIALAISTIFVLLYLKINGGN
jgi:hypothetical protein